MLGKVGLSPDALLGRVLAFPAGGLANSVLQVVDALAPSGDPKAPPRTAGDRFLAALTLVTDIDPLGLFGERSVLDAATSEIQRRLLDGAVSKLAGLAEPGYARSRRESP